MNSNTEIHIKYINYMDNIVRYRYIDCDLELLEIILYKYV